MKEENKLIIWSTDEYYNETDMKEWWQHQLEFEDEDIDIHDVAGLVGAKVDDITPEQKQALETLLPLYKAKQMKREPDERWWYEHVDMWLDDERCNLDIEVNGTIVCIADIGRWNGRDKNAVEVGTNIKDILFSDCEDVTWYSDGKDIRCDASHHDGTNHYLYRAIKDRDTIEELADKGELTIESLINATESLHPYVADVYGWEKEVA